MPLVSVTPNDDLDPNLLSIASFYSPLDRTKSIGVAIVIPEKHPAHGLAIDEVLPRLVGQLLQRHGKQWPIRGWEFRVTSDGTSDTMPANYRRVIPASLDRDRTRWILFEWKTKSNELVVVDAAKADAFGECLFAALNTAATVETPVERSPLDEFLSGLSEPSR